MVYCEIYDKVIVLLNIIIKSVFCMVLKISEYNEWYCFYFLFDMEIINGYMWKVYLIIISCNIYIIVCVVYEIFYFF